MTKKEFQYIKESTKISDPFFNLNEITPPSVQSTLTFLTFTLPPQYDNRFEELVDILKRENNYYNR